MSGTALFKKTIALESTTYRCIASRFPPVDLYEGLAAPEHYDMLHALESLTNPRLLHQPVATSSPIVAAFHYVPALGQGGRFNPDFASYYCALKEQTAVTEVVYHRERFLRESQRPATTLDVRIILADLKADQLIDIRGDARQFAECYDKDDYTTSQALGKSIYEADGQGIAYDSVRHAAGNCVVVFVQDLLSRPRQSKHLELRWDGQSIVSVIQKKAYRWKE
jgi:RES domain-containing protein